MAVSSICLTLSVLICVYLAHLQHVVRLEGVLALLTHLLVFFFIGQDALFVVLAALATFMMLMLLLLRFVPASFTLGEASIISQGGVWLAASLLQSSLRNSTMKITWFLSQSLIAGTCAIVFFLTPLLYAVRQSNSHPQCFLVDIRQGKFGRHLQIIVLSLLFYSSALAGILFIWTPWVSRVIGQDVLQYMLLQFSTPQHLLIFGYWLAVLGLYLGSISAFPRLVMQLPLIVQRKLFHFLLCILFVPAMMIDLEFVALNAACAACVLVMVEVARVSRLPPFDIPVEMFMSKFVDERDSGGLYVTHLYLLIGCSLPIWCSCALSDTSGIEWLGLVSVGLGDAFASIVGSRYGKLKWPGTKKTVEGTLASLLAQFIFFYLLRTFHLNSHPAQPLMVSLIIGAVLEAMTQQLDNLVVPLVVLLAFVHSS
eukprot:m.106014 g.106014  ORF g.106014 m.106014 type:complete len:426 (+) comp22519_c0_seq1:245-1522(+)